MIKIQRLNMDSSWWLDWGGMSVVLDPWLIGSEVDGARWLNQQWHVVNPVHVEDLPPYQAILISQSYSDHCHPKTLRSLDSTLPVFATPKPIARLKKSKIQNTLHQIPRADSEWVTLGGLKVAYLDPGKWLDPIYYGLVIANGPAAIVYAAHGFYLTDDHKKQLAPYNIELLLTTFTDFKLPSILGGHVNPGMDNAKKLVEGLNPRYVMNTHDEPKMASGLVSKMARVRYQDLDKVDFEGRFVSSGDYQALELEV